MIQVEDNAKKNQSQIEMKEEVAQDTYSHMAFITHSLSEFALDFVRVIPDVPRAEV